MRAKLAYLLLVTLVVAGWCVLKSGSALADDVSAVTAAALTVPISGGSAAEYTGASKCKMCHISTYKSWEATVHAKAMDALKPGNASEAKQKHGLDPAKDYSTDEKCIGCHTTGFSKAGGYAVPAAGDAKAAKQAEALAGVGCEACHGPGSQYNEVKKEIQKEKRMYKFDELAALGMTKVDASVCTGCHNDKSPTMEGEFKFEEAKADTKAVHAHEALKQREG